MPYSLNPLSHPVSSRRGSTTAAAVVVAADDVDARAFVVIARSDRVIADSRGVVNMAGYGEHGEHDDHSRA